MERFRLRILSGCTGLHPHGLQCDLKGAGEGLLFLGDDKLSPPEVTVMTQTA